MTGIGDKLNVWVWFFDSHRTLCIAREGVMVKYTQHEGAPEQLRREALAMLPWRFAWNPPGAPVVVHL